MKIEQINKWKGTTSDDSILNKELSKRVGKLSNAFKDHLRFTPNGFEGIMGAGTNSFNAHSVAALTKSFSNQHLEEGVKKTVVIGHDGCFNSRLFSNISKNVLLNNGFSVYLFDGNNATTAALLSFAIKENNFSGGLFISGSKKPDNFNGISIYDSHGIQLNSSKLMNIENGIKNIDFLSVEVKNNNNELFVSKDIVNKYIENISLKELKVKPLKIAISSPNTFLTSLLFDVLSNKGNLVAKTIANDKPKTIPKGKSRDTSNGAAYSGLMKIARKNKSDLAIYLEPSGKSSGFVIKYQRRYKFINTNQAAALYLEYKLVNMIKNNSLPKEPYIVKSVVSGSLVDKVAAKFGVKVIEVKPGSQNISTIIEKENGNLILGFESSLGMIIKNAPSNEQDSLYSSVAFSKMVSFYKASGENAYLKLKEMYKKYGVNRSFVYKRKIEVSAMQRLFKRAAHWKEISGKKVEKVIDYRGGRDYPNELKLMKILLSDGSWVCLGHSEIGSTLKVYIETFGSRKQEPTDIVIFEKKTINKINDESEIFVEKSFSWKTLFKYIIFAGILVGIMYFVFSTIYSSATSSSASIWDEFNKIIHLKNKTILLILLLAFVFNMFLDILMRWKLLKHHGQVVRKRDILISSVMGAFISYVTPLAIGGDGIGYWYMRKRGFKRAPLISTYLTMTVLWQMKNVVLTLILVPMGLFMFKDYFFSGDPKMLSIMIMFVIGFFWDMFSTFMIWMLTFSKRFQEFIIRNSIKMLEWIPYIHIADPTAMAAGPKYEFQQLRFGMKHIWGRKRLIAELMVYETIPKLFAISAFLPIGLGVMQPNLTFGSYWSQIVTTDVINTANSLALTPGSSGFSEFIGINLNQKIYTGGTSTAAALDLIGKVVMSWPFLLVSLTSILIVIGGEKRRTKYIVENKNNMLKGIDTKYKTSWYIKTSWVWVVLLGAWITVLCLL